MSTEAFYPTQPEGILHRVTAFVDYDVRTSAKERIVTGIAAPFDEEALILDPQYGRVNEVFRRGAFTKTIQLSEQSGRKVKLLALHDQHSMPLGVATNLREDAIGLYGEFRISNTRDGDEVLSLLEDGALDSFSVGFMPVNGKTRYNERAKLVERLEVRLFEVSLVNLPAYQGAKVLALREDFNKQEEQLAPKLHNAKLTLLKYGIK